VAFSVVAALQCRCQESESDWVEGKNGVVVVAVIQVSHHERI
jgi:hypothetical protein